MSLLKSILEAQGGGAVQQLGQRFGLDESQVKAALGQLVPALTKGVQKNTQAPGGLEALLGALGSGQHTRYIEQPETLAQPQSIVDGNAILGHLFGSKEVSRGVAAQASASTGIGQDVLKQMLPMAAAMVMGSLGKQQASGQGGAQGLLGMLDADGDGSPLDDILGMVKKLF